MKFSITIFESCSADQEEQARATWHLFTGRSLKEARQIAEQHARRGFNRFGSTIDRMNWGARGGAFPHNYRSATIRLDA